MALPGFLLSVLTVIKHSSILADWNSCLPAGAISWNLLAYRPLPMCSLCSSMQTLCYYEHLLLRVAPSPLVTWQPPVPCPSFQHSRTTVLSYYSACRAVSRQRTSLLNSLPVEVFSLLLFLFNTS